MNRMRRHKQKARQAFKKWMKRREIRTRQLESHGYQCISSETLFRLSSKEVYRKFRGER